MVRINTKRIIRKGLGVVIQTLFFCAHFLLSNTTSLISQLNPADSSNQLKFIYGFDNRRTQISEQNTLIYGGYIGAGYNDKIRMKLGISGIPFEVGRITNELGFQQRNRFYFFNVGLEYDFLIKNKFRLTAYGQFGAGENFYRYTNPNLPSNFEISGKALFLPLELGSHANYDLFPWLRLKLGGGWRFSLYEPTDYLSGYYIKLGASINLPLFIASARKVRNLLFTQ